MVALVAVVACFGSPEPTEPEEAARSVEAGAQPVQETAEQLAGDRQQRSEQVSAEAAHLARDFQQVTQGPTDFEQLQTLLPRLEGWTQADARGEQLSMPVAYSRAEAIYRRDDSRIEVEITDTALNPLLLAPMSMFLSPGFSERSSDGFKRAARIGGQPGLEEWNSGSLRGEVTAIVGNRFIVTAKGRDLTDLDPVRKAVEAVDFGTLASLE
jgi:hypothetical protein